MWLIGVLQTNFSGVEKFSSGHNNLKEAHIGTFQSTFHHIPSLVTGPDLSSILYTSSVAVEAAERLLIIIAGKELMERHETCVFEPITPICSSHYHKPVLPN